MKKLQSTTKKRLSALALVCIFALGSLMNFSPIAFADTSELAYSRVGEQFPMNTSMLEVPPGEATVSSPVSASPSVNIQPMDNPNSVAGGTFAFVLAPYSAANCTLGETYNQADASYAFQSILGAPSSDFATMLNITGLEGKSLSDIFNLSINQIKEKATVYADSLGANSTIASEGFEDNLFDRLINLTIEICVNAVSTSDSEVNAVLDVFDGVSATDVLNSPVGTGTLLVAASAVSGVADSANEPIGSLIVKSADRLGPKENNEKYSDPLDLLIYQMKVQEGLNITEDTPVREFVKLIITADGTFVPDETRSERYASIFYINGVVDTNAVFELPFRSFGVEAMRESFLAEFDGKLLDSTQLNISERTVEYDGYEDTETVVTISGIFNEPGYHSLQMSFAGWPFFAYIELSPAPVPVTGVALSPTEAELKVGDLLTLTATVSPDTASDKSLSYTSDNYSVADVNQNGVITAKAPGTATITVTTTDGSFTSVCTVTVIDEPEPTDFLKKIIDFIVNIFEWLFSGIC